MDDSINELRWNPLLGNWIIVAGRRAKRPWRPSNAEEGCPFCPGSPETAPYGDWDVLTLPNKYPALIPNPKKPEPPQPSIYRNMAARGYCEVVVETPKHQGDLHNIELEHLAKVVRTFIKEYVRLSSIDFVKYVAIFRNKGKEIGVSLTHPHSQIYALPFIPPRIQVELRNFREYYEKGSKCLLCDIIDKELSLNKRIIYVNNSFIIIHPYYAMWPYELHVYPRRHITSIDFLDRDEVTDLADALRVTTATYENLFNREMPYIMVMHNKPSDGGEYSYYHFHIEFYQPYREPDKLKYRAGAETGFWVFTYDGDPETKRDELRDACSKGVSGINALGECIGK